MSFAVVLFVLIIVGAIVGSIFRCYTRDLAAATVLAEQGSLLVSTACGPIEVQQAGSPAPGSENLRFRVPGSAAFRT